MARFRYQVWYALVASLVAFLLAVDPPLTAAAHAAEASSPPSGVFTASNPGSRHLLEQETEDQAATARVPKSVGLLSTSVGGTISQDTTWTPAGSPYIVGSSVTVAQGATLTIEPGVVVKFRSSCNLTVNGKLRAQGSSDSKIYFTSYKDDSVGGDSDGTTATPTKGDWGYVKLSSLASSSTIDHAVIRYAGYWALSDPKGAVNVYSNGHAITNDEFTNNKGFALAASPQVTLGISGNSAHDNDKNGIATRADTSLSAVISSDVTWRGHDLPYVVNASLTVTDTKTLTIEAGTVVKFDYVYGLVVKGTLRASGEPDDRVTLTSGKNDEIGGDTNGDGASTAPGRGDWSYVQFDHSSGSSSALEYTDLTYGGYGHFLFDGAVKVMGSAAPTIRHSVIAHVAQNGLWCDSDAAPHFNFNDVYDVGNYWVRQAPSSPVTIDATNNWWATSSFTQSTFLGNVDFVPWSPIPYTMTAADASAQGLFGLSVFGCYFGDPVNATTGNYVREDEDLSLPGKGPALAFRRTYNSQDAVSDGPLGYGWRHDYSSALRFDEGGGITVVYPDGHRESFEPDGSGGFGSPPGVEERLSTITGGYKLLFPDLSSYRYDSNGLLTALVDRYGNSTTVSYNANSWPTTISAPGGRSVTLVYSGSRVSTVTDSAGRSVGYSYDSAGNLVSVKDANGNTTSFGYDGSHQMTSISEPEPSSRPWITNTYSQGRVTGQVDAVGSTSTVSYDLPNRRTTIYDNRGNPSIVGYDERYRVTTSTDECDYSSARSYNASGFIESETDGNGHRTEYFYDANGNQTRVVDAEAHETNSEFDLSNNNLLWTEDEGGNRTTYSYDPTGVFLQSSTTPAGTTTFDYYSDGLLRTRHSAGATTSFEYDSAGNLTKLTDPLGNDSVFSYDKASRLTTATDVSDRTTRFSYDPAGHLLSVKDPLSLLFPGERHQVDFTYDKNGNRMSMTDAVGNVTQYGYDAMDRLTAVVDAQDATTTYTYDANHNLTSVTDARENTTSYTYTANNRLASVEDALHNITSFSYDGAGNLTETVYPNGNETYLAYTPDNLVSRVSFKNEPTSYDCTYTPTNLLASVTDNLGRVESFDYDAAGRLTQSADTVDPSITGGFASTYSWDEAGRVTGITPAGEATRSYDYDLAGRLTTLTLESDPVGSHTVFGYDEAGRRISERLPDGSQRGYGYDGAGRLASVVTTVATGTIAFSYTRDGNGNILTENDTRYTYDELGRLKTWYDPSSDATITYTFDAAGNLLSASGGSDPKSFTYDAANRITSSGYTYDENGNLTSDGSQDYAYDGVNRLITVRSVSTNTTIAEYEYDYLDRRIKSVEGTKTTYFHYDGASGNVVSESDASGLVSVRYVYDDSGQPHSMYRGASAYYFQLNSHGDVVALTDTAGAIVNRYQYDPWGSPLWATETVPNPLRYASYRYDESTGLYYLWHRYYSTRTSRFLSPDTDPGSLRCPTTLNAYVYCLDSPLGASDPEGMAVALAVIGVVLLVFVAVVAVANYFSTPTGQAASRRAVEGIRSAAGSAAMRTWVPASTYARGCPLLAKSGSKKGREKKQIEDVAKELDMSDAQRRAFGDHVEDLKQGAGRPGDENYSYRELLRIGKEFLGQ